MDRECTGRGRRVDTACFWNYGSSLVREMEEWQKGAAATGGRGEGGLCVLIWLSVSEFRCAEEDEILA